MQAFYDVETAPFDLGADTIGAIVSSDPDIAFSMACELAAIECQPTSEVSPYGFVLDIDQFEAAVEGFFDDLMDPRVLHGDAPSAGMNGMMYTRGHFDLINHLLPEVMNKWSKQN